MSNVGVPIEREKDSLSERGEVTEAKADSFECFNSVVTAFDEAVGEANIEGVENVKAPVQEHFAHRFERRDLQPVAGIEP